MNSFDVEIKAGKRYEFGKNWQNFLSTLTNEKIEIAERSLQEKLGLEDLNGLKFLDIGSGSGLFSLAARRLGAEVFSFDYDPASVACTRELRARYFPDDPSWLVKEGSILDKDFLQSLDRFDIVYSWGVLHHTGDMWTALGNASSLVKNKGTLFIAIYNDQGIKSRLWKKVKRMYCAGILGKILISIIFIPLYFFPLALILSAIKRENVFSAYKRDRGMSIYHDWNDWLGGFPFEVAKVEEIFHFVQSRNFLIKIIRTTNGLGTNEFVFVRGAND